MFLIHKYGDSTQNKYLIKPEDIICIRQEKSDCVFITIKGIYESKRTKINDLKKYVRYPLYQCHSYLIINCDRISRVGKFDVEMENGMLLGMAYAYTLRLKKAIEEYIEDIYS